MAQANRSPINRSPILLVGMIIAAIYVIMLIGLTRSTYFIGGAAFERAAVPTSFALASSRSVPAPEPGRPFCPVAELKPEDGSNCASPERTGRACPP